MPERLHAEMSPSSFPQWDKCICYKSGKVGQAANQGTYEHEVLEKLMNGAAIGEVDEVTIDKVKWAYETVMSDMSLLNVKPEEVSIEERVSIMDTSFEELTFGTLDVAFRDYVYDYKSGQIRSYWGQMAVYALGKMQAKNLDKINVVILYGRFKRKESYVIERAEAEDFVFGMIEKLRSEDKKPTKNDYCGWCTKKNTCPEIIGPVKSVASKMPEKTKITARRLNDLMKKPFEKMDGQQISELMPVADAVREWADSVLETARSLLDSGKPVPGWKLNSKPGNLYIKDAFEVSQLLPEVTPAEFIKACSPSLPKLAKAFREAHEGTFTSDKAAREKLEEVIAPMLARKSDSVSMVKDNAQNKP